MLGANRFVANKALNEQAWLDARRGRITATLIAKASTPAGMEEAMDHLRGVAPPVTDNSYMEFGRDMEPYISLWVKDRYGVMPNEWLIAHEDRPEFVATPDGISLDHQVISEVKTTGKDWGEYKKVPIAYRRQVQWQMFVTGAQSCVFAWLLREEREGRFVSGWFEPKAVVVERDDREIEKMSEVADRLLTIIKEG